MRGTINTLSAILLCAEFFCLGGSLFAYRNSTKDVLRGLVFLFGIVAIIVAW